jgi:hypothetical protein
MESRIQYGIFFLLFLVAGLSIYGFFFHSNAGPKVLLKADYHLSASSLAAAYDSQEDASDSLYLYKVLSVSGIVKKFRKNGAGNYIVFLGDRSPAAASVSCILDTLYDHRDRFLTPGDSLTIRGTCAGHLMDVILVQCIIEKQ